MGGLHIEQVALVCIGQLIKGPDLDDIVDAASLVVKLLCVMWTI